ncbi:ABC transporter substrate-binding protein [uncultured Amnibacterium sp.]|uniref:ABC transporter substrate-binding protein n=1 Tax=uncultured Amnibacterium sp. TaxID=1631851 RepID=UPI0035CAB0DC
MSHLNRSHPARSRASAAVAAVAGLALALTGCSSATPGTTSTSGGGRSSGAASDDSAVLGAPNKASGTPVTFGVLNLESGPVTFPEVFLAEQAAADYINDYRGGIGGHPIKLVKCATDGTPATSARCANQVLDSKPLAILGAADTGSPGAVAVYERQGLAYLGGIAFTPVEQNYKDAAIFSSISTGDNAAASVYLTKDLGVKSAAVVYTSDTQGTASGLGVIVPTLQRAGVTKITKIPIPPTASDVSSAVATVTSAQPDLVYVAAPAACPNVLSSLKQLGYTGKLAGVDTCTSPKAVQGANGGAEGLYFASPVLDPGDSGDEAALYRAALKKYAPADIALDSLATIGFQSMMNISNVLGKEDPAKLTTASILAAFRDGSDKPNFMGHPYTCDGKQILGASAVCNANEQIRQLKGGKIVVAKEWTTAGSYYVPAAG